MSESNSQQFVTNMTIRFAKLLPRLWLDCGGKKYHNPRVSKKVSSGRTRFTSVRSYSPDSFVSVNTVVRIPLRDNFVRDFPDLGAPFVQEEAYVAIP